MFSRKTPSGDSRRLTELGAMVAAIERSQAVIEFGLDGTILRANDNFLRAMGYAAEEVVGRPHRMFVTADYAAGADYAAFWRRLNSGEFIADKFLRLGKGGREVWIQASYNPVLGPDGKPYKVVKFATDVTAIEHERADRERERRVSRERQEIAVAAVGKGLESLSAGVLAYRIDGDFPAEYAKLQQDFNAAVAQLRQVMQVIVTTAGAIGGGAAEVSQAADDLSRRTEHQAATLEETAAALDQITATVAKTAAGAREGQALVLAARDGAHAAGDVVARAISAMGEIEGSARQISQIIGVIDEIAFQTNLLALNAGVEAARAGDAGRGFAVVASEVRSLAQRSAEAAKEIKALISASTRQVGSGVALVGETGEALQRIVDQVGRITALVSDISVGAQEQAVGLQQVNTAVNQMDQATQQNAAMVEESTAASHGLAQEARELERLMARFDVGRRDPAAVAPRRPSTPAAAFRTQGSAALKTQSEPDGWEEF